MARHATGVLVLDFRPFVRALHDIARTIGAALAQFTPAGKLRSRRNRLGGNGTDARRWPGEWQSTVCAGLLCHIAPCPSDAHALKCTHSCHGGGR